MPLSLSLYFFKKFFLLEISNKFFELYGKLITSRNSLKFKNDTKKLFFYIFLWLDVGKNIKSSKRDKYEIYL